MRSGHVGVKKKQLEDNPTKKTTKCHQNTKAAILFRSGQLLHNLTKKETNTISTDYQGESPVIEVRARGNSSPAFRIRHVVVSSKLAVKLRS